MDHRPACLWTQHHAAPHGTYREVPYAAPVRGSLVCGPCTVSVGGAGALFWASPKRFPWCLPWCSCFSVVVSRSIFLLPAVGPAQHTLALSLASSTALRASRAITTEPTRSDAKRSNSTPQRRPGGARPRIIQREVVRESQCDPPFATLRSRNEGRKAD